MNRRIIPGVVLGVLLGTTIGVGAYTFAYAKGWSYLTDDAAACANCHIMRQEYDGFWHSFYFTSGVYEDNIQINPHSREIVEEACRHCHNEIVEAIEGSHPAHTNQQLACLRCHISVGHLQ